jgi:hypothetical protein
LIANGSDTSTGNVKAAAAGSKVSAGTALLNELSQKSKRRPTIIHDYIWGTQFLNDLLKCRLDGFVSCDVD